MKKEDIIKRLLKLNYPPSEYWLFDKVEIRYGVPVISLNGLLEMKEGLGRSVALYEIEV